MRKIAFVAIAWTTTLFATALAQTTYQPPQESRQLLSGVDFSGVTEVDPAYVEEFVRCDGGLPRHEGMNTFDGVQLTGNYRCAGLDSHGDIVGDPSNVKALLKLKDGAILWQSKMALDVDGSWAAWNGKGGHTDQKCTAYRWSGSPKHCDRNSTDPSVRAEQVDPDRIPFVVMPTDGLKDHFPVGDPAARGAKFHDRTHLKIGDLGVVVYKNRWTPAFIADGGPFMRLGEGSSRVFEELGVTRCKKWDAAGTTCVGSGDPVKHDCGPATDKNPAYPYCDFGLERNVVFIVYPTSRDDGLTPANAQRKLCDFAKSKLKLTGSTYCRGL